MVGAFGGMVVTKYFTGQVNGAISQVSLLAPDGGAGAKATSIDGAINLLMIGLDTRDGNPKMGSRADSIIIGHIPATHDQVDLISIPRDTYVPIPASTSPHTSADGSDKINAAFQDGEPERCRQRRRRTSSYRQTIEQNWSTHHVPGGADRELRRLLRHRQQDRRRQDVRRRDHPVAAPRLCDRASETSTTPAWTIPHRRHEPGHRIPGTTPVIYKKGLAHPFNAYEALDYVRCRDFLFYATDYDRQRHQQQFIKALMQQAYTKGISDPLQISSFLKSLGRRSSSTVAVTTRATGSSR